MYAETDFLLALIKDEDWLGDAAAAVYRDHQDELWTSQFTLISARATPLGRYLESRLGPYCRTALSPSDSGDVRRDR